LQASLDATTNVPSPASTNATSESGSESGSQLSGDPSGSANAALAVCKAPTQRASEACQAVELSSAADEAAGSGDDYGRLQRRLLLATLLVTIAATLICWPLAGALAARSLLLGGTCGLLYLRLLARSVGRIGPDSRSLGRFQILVPALLVVAAARVPAIEILPALAGFVLYKPALLLQAFIAP
jgi:ATP synthase protein I